MRENNEKISHIHTNQKWCHQEAFIDEKIKRNYMHYYRYVCARNVVLGHLSMREAEYCVSGT